MRRKNGRNSGEAMRAMLEKFTDYVWKQYGGPGGAHGGGAHGIADLLEESRAALAAPPRNCDVGTATEQHMRFVELCRKFTDDCEGCPVFEADSITPCELVWAQLPYEADEAKGGEP